MRSIFQFRPRAQALGGFALLCVLAVAMLDDGQAQTAQDAWSTTGETVYPWPSATAPAASPAQRAGNPVPAQVAPGGDLSGVAQQPGSSLNPTPRLDPTESAQTPQSSAAKGANQGIESASLDRRLGGPRVPLEITEFQKFVADATGKRLALFGYSLFGYDAFKASDSLPAPADYVIGPGDVVQLHVWGAVDADLRLVVDRYGQIPIPKVGTVSVAGVRASQLEGVIAARIGTLFRNFRLSATLGQMRSIQVFVVGHARRPGTYLVSSASTLVNALFESGGPASTGSLRAIQLKREGQVVSTIDLYRFIAQGDKSADLRLLSGDVIVVPPAGPRVALLGALTTPAIYELKSAQESLSDVLGYGGGLLSTTSPHKVQVERLDPNQPGAQRSVETRALDAAGLKSGLRDGDVLTLFKIAPQFANAVTLRGNVAAPLRYPFRPGMKVSDLIPEREALIRPDYYVSKNMLVQFDSGPNVAATRVVREVRNLLEEVNWDYALIERLDAKAVRSQLIPFNLGRAVLNHDPRDDLELMAGDVVTVFSVDDVPVPVEKRTQYVRLGGEVKIPGLYQILPGERLPELVARAGGVTANAFVYGTEFLRESARRQQQSNLDAAVRRFEADISGANLATLQNTAADAEKVNSAQAQIVAQQQMLARMKTLKASGRIALDMDRSTPTLPNIALEDGDIITVPTPSSFVGVFGAVLSERTLVEREGFVAGDYVKRAGLTRYADREAIMILRADGTVESDAERANALFSVGPSLLDSRVFAGDTIFIPEKLDRETSYNRFMRGLKDWTAVFYQFGLGAAAIKTLR